MMRPGAIVGAVLVCLAVLSGCGSGSAGSSTEAVSRSGRAATDETAPPSTARLDGSDPKVTCEELFELNEINQILGESYTAQYDYSVRPARICIPQSGTTNVGMIQVKHNGADLYRKETGREFGRRGSEVERIDLGDEAIYVRRGGAQYVAALFGANYVVVQLVDQDAAPEALEQLAEYANSRDPEG